MMVKTKALSVDLSLDYYVNCVGKVLEGREYSELLDWQRELYAKIPAVYVMKHLDIEDTVRAGELRINNTKLRNAGIDIKSGLSNQSAWLTRSERSFVKRIVAEDWCNRTIIGL